MPTPTATASTIRPNSPQRSSRWPNASAAGLAASAAKAAAVASAARAVAGLAAEPVAAVQAAVMAAAQVELRLAAMPQAAALPEDADPQPATDPSAPGSARGLSYFNDEAAARPKAAAAFSCALF